MRIADRMLNAMLDNARRWRGHDRRVLIDRLDLEKTGVRVVWPGKIAGAEIFTSFVYFAKPL
jgi:hypothetical protein